MLRIYPFLATLGLLLGACAPARAAVTQPLAIREGFNFVSVTVTPAAEFTAGALMTQHPQVVQIFRFDAAAQSFRYRITLPNGSPFGDDFALAPGVGYVIKAAGSATVQVTGEPHVAGGSASLVAGFNFVGLPPLDSQPMARALLADHPALTSVFRWNPQTASFGFALRLPGGTLFGDDFALEDGGAFFLNSAQPGTVAFGSVRSNDPWPWYGTAAPVQAGTATLDPTADVIAGGGADADLVREVTDTTVTLAGEALAARSFEVGQVLVGTSAVDGREGYLRKVTAVQPAQDGSAVTLVTEPASMEDAFPDCEFSFEQPISAAMVRTGTASVPGVSLAPSRGPVELSPIEINLNTDTLEIGMGGLKCYGKATLKPTLFFDIKIAGRTLESLTFKVKCETALDAKFSAEIRRTGLQGDDENIKLMTTRLYTVVLWIPTPAGIPVPVVFDLDINLYLVANAEGQVQAYVGYQKKAVEEYGFAYTRGAAEPYRKIYNAISDEGKAVPPTLSGDAKLRAGIKPEFAVTFYKAAGPKLSAYLGAFLAGGIVTRYGIPGTFLWWQLAGEFSVNAGGELKAFSSKLVDIDLKIYGKEWPWAASPRLAAAFHDVASVPQLSSAIDLSALRVLGNYQDAALRETIVPVDPSLVVWTVTAGDATLDPDGKTLTVAKYDKALTLHAKHTQLAKDGEELKGEFDLLWPTVASLEPPTYEVNVPVEIRGFHFGAAQGTSTVTLDGRPVAPTGWSDTAITFVPPESALRGGVVLVSVQGMASNRFALDGAPAAILPADPYVTKAGGMTFAMDPPTDVTWSVEPPEAGTIGPAGYFKPARGGNATIRATLAGPPGTSWTTTARVTGITVDPAGGESKTAIALSVTPVNVPPGSTYSWGFGDGDAGVSGLTSPSTTHTFEIPDKYVVTAIVRNAAGETLDTATREIEITPKREILVKTVYRDPPTNAWLREIYEYYVPTGGGEVKHGYHKIYYSTEYTSTQNLLHIDQRWVEGKVDGQAYWYDTENRLYMQQTYAAGRKMYEKSINQYTGHLMQEIEYRYADQGGTGGFTRRDYRDGALDQELVQDSLTTTYPPGYPGGDPMVHQIFKNGQGVVTAEGDAALDGSSGYKPVDFWTHRYPDGVKSSEGWYSSGAKWKHWVYYHPNGVKSGEDTYFENYVGLYTKRETWYSNGNPEYVYTYDGTYRGILTREVHYKEDGTLDYDIPR